MENIIKTTLTEEQTRELIYDFYESVKNKKGSESLRTLLTTFVNKITISNSNICIQFKINFCGLNGAGEGTWTPTVTRQILSLVRLPIPPLPRYI